MEKHMKSAYRLFERKQSGVYYIQNNSTREQRSLGTTDREEAKRLWEGEHHAQKTPALNLDLGKFYPQALDRHGHSHWEGCQHLSNPSCHTMPRNVAER